MSELRALGVGLRVVLVGAIALAPLSGPISPMRLIEFWPLYLRAHHLPGTRSLHYVATILGLMALVDAVLAKGPLIAVVGISLSYAIAIGAHWLIEGNQPLIKINPFWGAVADIRMGWLAVSGQLAREMQKLGIINLATSCARLGLADPPHKRASLAIAFALPVASVVGLVVGLSDFNDLFEPAYAPVYPVVQLGMPVVAFAIALAATGSMLHANYWPLRRNGGVLKKSAAADESLRRASVILCGLGTGTFGAAELAEQSLSQSGYVYAATSGLAILLCLSVAGGFRSR